MSCFYGFGRGTRPGLIVCVCVRVIFSNGLFFGGLAPGLISINEMSLFVLVMQDLIFFTLDEGH